MKAAVFVVLVLLGGTALRADWKDLKPGMDRAAVSRCLGTPLMETKGRAMSGVWTYDCGGYAMFSGGRLVHWEKPKPVVPDPRALAQKPRTLPAKNKVAAK